jgi:hypothetical protein
VEHGILLERDHGPLAEGVVSFHTTHWTIVMRAAQSHAPWPWGQSALAELCRLFGIRSPRPAESGAAMSATLCFLDDFESAREYAMLGVQIWRSRGSQSHPEDLDTPVAACFCNEGSSEWHLEEIASCLAPRGSKDQIRCGHADQKSK